MALITTAEQEALRDVMRAFLGKYSTEADVRSQVDTELGYDQQAWATAAEQIGMQALPIPERFGGAGYGFDELAVVLEETGRVLFTGPVLPTVVLASSALLLSGDDRACEHYLPLIAEGSTVATLAVSEDSAAWTESDISVSAARAGQDWVLTGVKRFVLSGAQAGLVVVAARTDRGVSLFTVETPAQGLTVQSLPVMDLTRPMASLTFDNCPAVLVGHVGAGWATLTQVFDRAIVALACEQVGAAAAVLESTVDYLKVRQQFGRAIGSFQAVKHRCADMLVELESARSAAAYASAAIAAGAEDASAAASIAKVYCSQAFYHIAAESIQLHGGIGFTWEHPAHLYFKRAKSSEVLFGSPAAHRERIAELIGMS
ncbi:acyl-CoA dehydrogenase family protein [Mycobacterium colombiense]|uniref:Acyl-CoA dehydrogenase domain-containing protein n=1 Tax=Mycobacterium colombiense CECT 3035 TaxID=1041522 RepID=J4TIS1_9MYCO|nr:acyl-CoA dehydrogenase family protein [Mycobacterium colombiense]EJO89443.1 acyl-CoA dehydrogenase domain-containing protein [Mycobacterium colombiense CECT 3035]